MNSQKIEKKIKISWIAGLLIGVVILILAVLSVLNIIFFLNVGYTASSFIDVIVVFSLTYGIYRKSRVCAILMLVYVLLNQLYASIQTGQWSMGFLTILLIWIFSDGIRALFEYHKIYPNKKVSSGQVAVKSFAIFVAILVTFFIYVGIRSSYLKSQNQILNSSNLDIKITKALTDAELIEKGEKILFFYSNKLVNKEKSFIFISDRK
jgi:hypothetical protein